MQPGTATADPAPFIRTLGRPDCVLCGAPGVPLYSGLRDFCYDAPGEWGFRECSRPECQAVWLDPAPVPEDLGKAYTGYYTHHQPEPGARLLRDVCWAVWMSYLGVRFGYTRGVGPRWRRVLSPLALLHPGGRGELDAAAMHLPAPAGPARVLDVGCGSGVLLARMKSLGWEVEGQDVDPGAVEAARARGIPVRLGALEQVGFADDSFDAVHSAHVIEHVHDPARLLRECYRILKPAGTLVILTPNARSLGHKFFGRHWLCLDPPRHLVLFTASALRKAAQEAGFSVRMLDTTARTVWVYAALSHCVRQTGRGEMKELNRPANLLRGALFQLRQRWALGRRPEIGEELRLIATK